MNTQRQSDPILRLLESSLAVEESVTVQGPVVAPLLDQRLAPRFAAPKGLVESPDSLPILFGLRDELGASREQLAEIEERNIEAVRRITGWSRQRISRFDELQADFTWLRNHFEGLLGPVEADVVAGLQGPTARNSAKLLRQVRIAIRQLSKPGLELTPDRFGAVETDPGKIAEELQEKADRFSRILAGLRRARREAQLTQMDKNRALERHKKTFLQVSQALESFYRLAGLDELADRIRPSQVRGGRRAAEVEDAPDGPAPEGDSDGQGVEVQAAENRGSETTSPSAVPAAAPAEEREGEASSVGSSDQPAA